MLQIDATAIVVFAVVWILVLVLGRIFFKPMGRILDARAERIARDQAAASEALEAYGRDLRRIEEGLRRPGPRPTASGRRPSSRPSRKRAGSSGRSRRKTGPRSRE